MLSSQRYPRNFLLLLYCCREEKFGRFLPVQTTWTAAGECFICSTVVFCHGLVSPFCLRCVETILPKPSKFRYTAANATSGSVLSVGEIGMISYDRPPGWCFSIYRLLNILLCTPWAGYLTWCSTMYSLVFLNPKDNIVNSNPENKLRGGTLLVYTRSVGILHRM